MRSVSIAGLTALVTWALASLGVLDMGATGSFRQLRNFGLQAGMGLGIYSTELSRAAFYLSC